MNLKHITRLGRIYIAYAIKKEVKPKYPPYRLWIEPTSMCNLKCPMCGNKDLDEKQLGMMDFELFKKIIDESKDFVHDANIHHRGESLLHKRLFDMIGYAKKKGMTLKMHTNTTLLNEKNSLKILESGLDVISFSFDGLDKETYERYRIGAKFEKTIENITNFLRLKKRLKLKKPLTVLELIDFRESDNTYNLDKLKEFKKQFLGLPLNKLIVKRPHNFGGIIDIKTVKDNTVYSPCTFLWHSLVIFWNGDVSPCTQDFHGEIILGNVKENTLKEIFAGEKLVSLRKKALKGDIKNLNPCSRCDMIRRKRFLAIPVDSFNYLEK